MHLILARTAYSDTENLEHIVEHLGCKRPDPETSLGGAGSKGVEKAIQGLVSPSMISSDQIGGLGEVVAWMKASDKVRLLALHTPPELAIARAVEQEGQTLAEATRTWTESARELLAADRPNRNRSLVVHAITAHADKAGFAAKLAEFLGLRASAYKGEQAGDGHSEPSHLYRVIAAQVVAASTELQDLRDELEARSTPLAMDPQEVAADCEQALADIARVTEEKDEFLRRMHDAQEELESYFLDAKDKKAKQEKLSQEDLQKLREQRDRARRNLHNMKNSRSWKLTAPLRGFRRKGANASDRSTEA